jgi:putative flippase GtrA
MESFFARLDALPLLKYKPVRYVLSGGTSTFVNFATLYVLTEFLHMWYLASAGVAVAFGFTTSFVLQKFWTFRSMPLESIRTQLPMHIGLSALNILFNTAALYLLVEYAGLWYMLAQFLSVAVLACFNYYVYRTHIFSDAA